MHAFCEDAMIFWETDVFISSVSEAEREKNLDLPRSIQISIRFLLAGGVTFLELLEAIRTVAQANVVGADVNELAPMLDASGVSTATACKVLRELLLAIAK